MSCDSAGNADCEAGDHMSTTAHAGHTACGPVVRPVQEDGQTQGGSLLYL